MAYYVPLSYFGHPYGQAQGRLRGDDHIAASPNEWLASHFLPEQHHIHAVNPNAGRSDSQGDAQTQTKPQSRKRRGEPMKWVEYVPLPHFAPEEVEAQVNDGKVRIVAKRIVGDEDNHVSHETRRSVDIPADVDSSQVTCHYVRRQFVLVEGPRNKNESSKQPESSKQAASSVSAIPPDAGKKPDTRGKTFEIPATPVSSARTPAAKTREATPPTQPRAAAAPSHQAPASAPASGAPQDAAKKSTPTATVKPLPSSDASAPKVSSARTEPTPPRGNASQAPASSAPAPQGQKQRKPAAAASAAPKAAAGVGTEIRRVPDDGTGDVYPDFPRDSGLDFTLTSNRETIARVAAELKQIGNTLFKEQKYERAFGKYSKALRYIERLIHGPILGQPEVQELRVQYELPLLNNLAACNLKLENFPEALEDCDKVLAVQPDNVKALFRRGEAYFGLLRYDEAVASFQQAHKVDPHDKAVLKELHRAQKMAEQAQQEVEKEMCAKMFKL